MPAQGDAAARHSIRPWAFFIYPTCQGHPSARCRSAGAVAALPANQGRGFSGVQGR